MVGGRVNSRRARSKIQTPDAAQGPIGRSERGWLRLAQTPSDAALVQIIGRHFEFDAVADGEADPPFAHFARDGGEHGVLVLELHPEHRAREHGLNAAFDFDMFFHGWLVGSNAGLLEKASSRTPAGQDFTAETKSGARLDRTPQPKKAVKLSSDCDRHRHHHRRRRRRRIHDDRRRHRRRRQMDALRGDEPR